MAAVKAAVEHLPFKTGFTILAKGFVTAEDMFTKGSHEDSLQSMMLVTDGTPSSSFMTNEVAEQ